MEFEAVGGQVAEELQAVAAFDQRDAFGCQALEFDRSHFRAVLLALAACCCACSLSSSSRCNAVGGAVKQIDGRP